MAISLDDYFVNQLTPKDEFGNYDFESPYCMDLGYLTDIYWN